MTPYELYTSERDHAKKAAARQSELFDLATLVVYSWNIATLTSTAVGSTYPMSDGDFALLNAAVLGSAIGIIALMLSFFFSEQSHLLTIKRLDAAWSLSCDWNFVDLARGRDWRGRICGLLNIVNRVLLPASCLALAYIQFWVIT